MNLKNVLMQEDRLIIKNYNEKDDYKESLQSPS